MIDWLFFGPSQLIRLWPHAGLAIGLTLLAVQAGLSLRAGKPMDRRYFREAPVLAGLVWIIFGFYERQIDAVKLVTGDPTPLLRIDLLVLTPILYVLSVAAILSALRQWRDGAGK